MIIAIEGVDGSGKTTQAKMLVEKLKNSGHQSIYVKPLYVFIDEKDTPASISPRRARVNKANIFKRIFLGIFGYFYALACYLKMKLQLSRGKIIVCDRYFYQFFFDLFGGFGLKVASIFPKPDIVFLLSGELSTFYVRMGSSFDKAVDKSYYDIISKLYNKLSKKYDFIEINADYSKEEINDIIFKQLLEKLG